MSNSEPPVLFIGGTGRCGSSILREAFGQHNLCGILPFEHRFLIDPDGIVDFYSSFEDTWSPYNQDLRIKRLCIFLNSLAGNRLGTAEETEWLLPEEQYQGWNLEERIVGFNELINQLMEELVDFKFDAKWVGGREFDGDRTIWFSHGKQNNEVKGVLQKFSWAAVSGLLASLNKEIYVEDNTWNLLYARQLHELFPKAKFVHIYRHPLDVVASYVSQPWCPNDAMEAAEFYASLMDRWYKVKAELPSDSYIEISFESFVKNPQLTYERICDHMGIEFEETMMNIEISMTPVGKWKEKISTEEHSLLCDRLSRYIGEYGYF
ncbi:MAG: hypothetical protein COB49_06455 [Alphaproteobacteria bacterium]|nr:MAG: hypothetical protein COB49_06455 [Alphaproteobacteria bacterium]